MAGKAVEKLEKIDSSLLGIGKLLQTTKFSVPSHQRAYAWEDEQIEDIFRDIHDAQKKKGGEYFLGTVVLSSEDDGRKLIIDGQQRLVTTIILIAAMRDYFHNDGQEDRARDIERDYLFKRSIRTQEVEAYIHLIPDDREFFLKRIIANPDDLDRKTDPTTVAQRKLVKAAELAAGFVKKLVGLTQKPDDALLDYIEYLNADAKIIAVDVDSEANAYIIFEVLNDRGLELSLTDLLKNYVFSHAADKLPDVQLAWSNMVNTLADIGDESSIKTFIRHAWVAKRGLTREKELYGAIKKEVTSKAKAADFAKELSKTAVTYAAFSNPSHAMWAKYDGEEVSQSIEVLDMLGVTQIRPLLLAVLATFTDSEVKKTLPMLVSWTVRFLISGSGGSGPLESNYSDSAKAVSSKTITTAKGLWQHMQKVVPGDVSFEKAFTNATVSKVALAKYYLRVLNQKKIAGEDELIINPDKEKVNLEHILPETISAPWQADFSDAQHKAYLKRIGNFTLLGKRLNSKVANGAFADKKKEYASSKIQMTLDLLPIASWTPAEIDTRQAEMAKLAVKAWPMKPS